MNKLKLLSGIFLLVFIVGCFGCQKDDEEVEIFQVEVIGKGFDCGDVFLIKFNEEDENKVRKYHENSNAFYPVFYAINLIEEHKEKELILNVTLEKCGAIDLPFCTTMGPGFGRVCIKTSETISLTFP